MEKSINKTSLADKNLFENYFKEHSFDEMFTTAGLLKPGWETLSANMLRLGADVLQDRQWAIDWHLAENGVTYNVNDDPDGVGRPWQLNSIPFLLQEKEWEKVTRGVQQRAKLLNLILKDVYGKRELISKGIIPQEVIFCHRSFLHQANQMYAAKEVALPFYACDLARGPHGEIWVINDRAQAPSGMGYALENRLATSRVLPELFSDLYVRKLAQFFNRFKELLRSSSPRKNENPLMVLMTPGPLNETYFEQAYLASFLDLPIVQGNDLVVRNNHLWMKSLKGLKQVDVVLRRVDEAYADPLELFGGSRLGTAGLLNVVREGNVGMVNPIGSGILENRGLLPFMPAVSKYFLNEDLILPQVATWWCGQKKECNFVLENMNKLVIKRIQRSGNQHIFVGEELSNAEKETLKKAILEQPHMYVGQERVGYSTVPNFESDEIVPRNAVIRSYAIAHEGSYDLMPGGLVRVGSVRGNSFVTNKDSSTSKDLWVVNKEPEAANESFDLPKNAWADTTNLGDLSSQTAESLFWTGRYIGRISTTARFLRLIYQTLTDASYEVHDKNESCLNLLLQGLTHLTGSYPGFVGKGGEELLKDPRATILDLTLNAKNGSSLSASIDLLLNCCSSLRKLFSGSAWRVLESIKTGWKEFQDKKDFDNRSIIAELDQLIIRSVAFVALVRESILPDQGLTLYSIGLNTEIIQLNVSQFRSLLVAKKPMQLESEVFESLLVSMESLNTYRYTYKTHLKLNHVLDLILFDQEYPRSIGYQVNELRKHMDKMPQAFKSTKLAQYQKPLFAAHSSLMMADSEKLSKAEDGVREQLDDTLRDLSDNINDASIALAKKYFTHSYQQSLIHHSKTEF